MVKKTKFELKRKHWNWIRSFELEFGFEVMYLEELESGRDTWLEFCEANLRCISDNTDERLAKLRGSMYDGQN